MKKILKLAIILIHKIIVFFMISGFLIPKKYLFFYVIMWPSVYLSWQLNNNKCILTQIEYYLDNNKFPPLVQDDHDYPFIRRMIKNISPKLANQKILTNKQIHYIIVLSLTILWFIGVIRYFK
jgi:hypothetical protein